MCYIHNSLILGNTVLLPAQIKMKAGSSAMLVSRERLLNVSFSVQAQTPMASIPRPMSCKRKRSEPLFAATGHTYPEDDVKAKNDIFKTTGDLAVVASSSL